MIKVDQPKTPPQILRDKGEIEKQKAIKHYEALTDGESKKRFTFSVYSDEQVKGALNELFHGKCAYCETFYASSQPMDIEHWRPKGGYEEENGDLSPRGYYWLASTWENLLPSDIDCNRRRKQRITPLGIERIQGKANQFPLETGSSRATKPGEEKLEKPLLINPYEDNPEEYFKFDDDAVILPKEIGVDRPSPRARASIEIYALNRSDLVIARREHLLKIRHHIFVIQQLGIALDNPDLGENVHAILEDLLAYEMNVLKHFKQPGQPYTLMAKQVIDSFLETLKTKTAD